VKAGLILVGGGGHCRSCIDVIESEGKHPIVGIIDVAESVGTQVLGYPVIGSDAAIPSLVDAGNRFLITLGQIKSAAKRIRLFELLGSLGADLVRVVSPTAHVSRHASIGNGTIVMHHAIVNAGAKVGANCILNTKALIEHDALVGDHCHVSTAAVINGGARVGARTFVGSASTVFNQVSVGNDCVIGAGSVVSKDVEGPGTFTGNPLRERESG
jgi:sugar O-acyltransferase (sialic acid O-acetyltransferase NeuD family)